jgi:hypothetical protein
MPALLFMLRGLFRQSVTCLCDVSVEGLTPDIREKFNLPPIHSLVDHFTCLRLFVNVALLSLKREITAADLETIKRKWKDVDTLHAALQYERWYHLKEHLLSAHTGTL